MTGSGPTCFGIFNSRAKALEFKKRTLKFREFQNFWIWSGGLLNKQKRNLILPLQ